MEVWKDIQGYEGLYQVSNLGNVRSLDYGGTRRVKILKLDTQKNGYKQVKLYKNGKCKNHRIHRLVSIHFIDNPKNLPKVNHKNENKADNRVENLEWCDSKYNNNFGTRTKRIAKAISKKVICITTGEIFDSIKEASRQTGANQSHIVECCRGKRKSAGKDKDGNKLIWEYGEE